ncbi:MAG TPA: hypothetical protein VFX28_14570 [Methylomirabilota bacterium]|nr:hypothetical protein [Methylomirabilota bacterium]
MSQAEWPVLVLVEGLPGSGKSTTAQWIAHELGRRGRPARWVHEGQAVHPVLGSARGPYRSWKDYLAGHLGAWARFAATARTSATVMVLDGAFLQASVHGTLSRGLDPDTTLAYVARVADVLRPLAPALVYFRDADPETAWRKIGERRGMAWTLLHMAAGDGMPWARARELGGMDALLAYWREHARVCDAAAARSNLETLTLESGAGDWPARRRRVAEFVRLPPGEDASRTDLARFAGRYRSESGREARLSVRDEGLVLDGLLLWSGNRLLPRAPDAFDAESWPVRLTFEADATGEVRRFRLEAPDLAWRGPAGVYEKLA